MNAGLLLVLRMIIFYNMTSAAVYNYNTTSEEIQFMFDREYLSGFRNITDKDFVLGGLFPVHNCINPAEKGNLELVEAMLFAIDQINNDVSLLPNLTVGYDVRDTCNDDQIGLYETFSVTTDYDSIYSSSFALRDHDVLILGIIGPANTTISHSVATMLEAIRVPMISYGSSDAFLSNQNLYKYFLRTIPSDNLQPNAMVDLVSYFGWEYVSILYNDNREAASNAFINGANQHNICLNAKINIPSGDQFNKTYVEAAARELLNSTAESEHVVVAFTDEDTILALFEELNKTNNSHKFVWIASDGWASSDLVRDKFPELTSGMYGFQLHTDHVKEFDNYFSQLTNSTNTRNPFFKRQIYYDIYCKYHYEGPVSKYNCPDDLTAEPNYSQGKIVPFVINAVYAYAHALQNFLDNNCNKPLRWDHTTQRCDGMKHNLTGENLLGYLFNVSFNDAQNRSVSFDENGDPPGMYVISNLQINKSGQYEYVSVGYWYSAIKKRSRLILNHTENVTSRCPEPCSDGMIHSISNPNCASCFECIPCVGPTYSNNSSGTKCNNCSDNHWGNNPLLGSTHCVEIKVRHAEFSDGWSIVSMSIATIALLILAAIAVIFAINWKTPVVKSSDREQTVMLMAGIGICCTLTYIVVAPPSNAICLFQRIGVWLCFSLSFGALLVKITRITRIFYSIETSANKPTCSNAKYQIMFTMAIVFGQLILVVIGLIIDPPIVKKDPAVVATKFVEQIGDAPEIVETCQPSHTVILTLSVTYNSIIIVGCIILGWITRKFPENFNEAEQVMFTSFTIVVVWVLFVPLYLYTDRELQIGVLALGIVLSALALMAGVFFPRIYIIVFQKHKNTIEYVKCQNHLYAARSAKSTLQQSKALIIYIYIL